MPICFACDKVVYKMYNHLFGVQRTPKCTKIDGLYDSKLVTKEWYLLVDKEARSKTEEEWRAKYGAGNSLVYVYLAGALFTRVGKTSTSLAVRLMNTKTPPTDEEEVYILASGLSERGAKLLEACLICCHDIYHSACRVHCYRYESVKPPKGMSCSSLRADAVLVLRGLYERIESGTAMPQPKIKTKRQTRRSAPTAGIEPVLENLTNEQLVAEKERLEERLARVTSLLHARDDKRRGEEEPAQKRRRYS